MIEEKKPEKQKKPIMHLTMFGVAYRVVMVKCGDGHCSKCPHGPYVYARVKKGRRWRELYVGKVDSEKWKRILAIYQETALALDPMGTLSEGKHMRALRSHSIALEIAMQRTLRLGSRKGGKRDVN